MIWQDIVTEKALTDQNLAEGLAAAFDILPADVLIHRSIDDFPNPGHAKVVCVVTERQMGFQLILSVYTFFDSEFVSVPVIERVIKFAAVTHSACLLSDDSYNPYVMVHTTPTGAIAKVNVNEFWLDELGDYLIK